MRELKKLHPNRCCDVASAALRDLGCDNYNEGWVPLTLTLGDGGKVLDTNNL